MQQKVVLKSMTLRGVGSYMSVARLEFRPLTIFCGKNGSGKSTWFKMLNMLKKSQRVLPFYFLHEEREDYPRYGAYTNAMIRMAEDEGERRKLSSYEEDIVYGPLGTIGLQFTVTEDLDLDQFAPLPDNLDAESLAQAFLWTGRCPKGTKFQLRMAHPQKCFADDPGDALYDFVDLRINDTYAIRFRKPVDLSYATPPASGHMPYQLSCSQAFLPSTTKADGFTERELAEIEPTIEENGAFSFKVSPVEHHPFCGAAHRRIRELLNLVLSGTFYLGAIRLPHDYEEIEEMAKRKETPDLSESIRRRHVGDRGELAIALEEQFAYNRMRQAGPPFADFSFETFVSVWLERLVDTRIEHFNDMCEYESMSDTWPNPNEPPTGFLVSDQPAWQPTSFDDHLHPDSRLSEFPYYKMNRFQHGCFGNLRRTGIRGKVATPPRPLSEGFHQIIPMIVQTGLMRRNELLVIENPEVHLHPKLQLDVTEFLMGQAKINKFIIIETHSDLVVRRVLRGILEEEISQEHVGVHFATLIKSADNPVGYHWSILERLKINNNGEIQNWPEGFMDDSVKESRRLLDSMYGKPPHREEEENNQ
jgi:energy-coupling factor transporter ATP-binding protein EcfA2